MVPPGRLVFLGCLDVREPTSSGVDAQTDQLWKVVFAVAGTIQTVPRRPIRGELTAASASAVEGWGGGGGGLSRHGARGPDAAAAVRELMFAQKLHLINPRIHSN